MTWLWRHSNSRLEMTWAIIVRNGAWIPDAVRYRKASWKCSFWFWVMACHVPKLFSWDVQLNGCPGVHNQIWCLFILEVGIIGGLEAHGRGSSLCFCLKIKDANHVNTTWPSGSQEEIKISDALSGGCQIEQLKESLHLHMGNKVLENENTHTHTHMQTKPQVPLFWMCILCSTLFHTWWI